MSLPLAFCMRLTIRLFAVSLMLLTARSPYLFLVTIAALSCRWLCIVCISRSWSVKSRQPYLLAFAAYFSPATLATAVSGILERVLLGLNIRYVGAVGGWACYWSVLERYPRAPLEVTARSDWMPRFVGSSNVRD